MKPIKATIAALINERNLLINLPEVNKDKLDAVSEEIAVKEAEENRNIIVNNFKQFSENRENISMQ